MHRPLIKGESAVCAAAKERKQLVTEPGTEVAWITRKIYLAKCTCLAFAPCLG